MKAEKSSRISPLESPVKQMAAQEIFRLLSAWDSRGSAYKMLVTVSELLILLTGIPAVFMLVQGETPRCQPEYLRMDSNPMAQLEQRSCVQTSSSYGWRIPLQRG
jgi:hypothetical protein